MSGEDIYCILRRDQRTNGDQLYQVWVGDRIFDALAIVSEFRLFALNRTVRPKGWRVAEAGWCSCQYQGIKNKSSVS